MARRNDMAVLELIWLHETDDAVKVAQDEVAEPVWLPLNQVEFLDESGRGMAGLIIEIVIREGLARDKGLI